MNALQSSVEFSMSLDVMFYREVDAFLQVPWNRVGGSVYTEFVKGNIDGAKGQLFLGMSNHHQNAVGSQNLGGVIIRDLGIRVINHSIASSIG